LIKKKKKKKDNNAIESVERERERAIRSGGDSSIECSRYENLSERIE
jgi:hypothetical protein